MALHLESLPKSEDIRIDYEDYGASIWVSVRVPMDALYARAGTPRGFTVALVEQVVATLARWLRLPAPAFIDEESAVPAKAEVVMAEFLPESPKQLLEGK
jgi:hypothetical protein